MRRLIIGFLLLAGSGSAMATSIIDQLAGAADGTWTAITTTNTPNDIKPSPLPAGVTGYRGKWIAWSSAAYFPSLGTCGKIVYWGGGHQDYWGSDVTGLDLCGAGAGPTWETINPPYIPPGGESYFPRLPCGEYGDGSPAPPHTYNMLVGDPATNRLITINAQSNSLDNGDAAEYAYCAWAFNLNTNAWEGPWPHGGAKYGAATWDPEHNLVWYEADSGETGVFSSLDPATGTVVEYNKSTNTLQHRTDAATGYDPIAHKIVTMSFRGGGSLRIISERDPASPSTQGVSIASTNMPTLAGQQSMSWSPTRGAWIVWANLLGADVYEAKRVDTAGTITYDWTLLTDAGNAFNPGGGTNGSYQKMQLVTLPDDSEILIGQIDPGVSLTGNVVAFKIPTCTVDCIAPTPVPPVVSSNLCSPLTQAVAAADACDQAGVFVCERFTSGLVSGTAFAGTATPAVSGGVLNMTIPATSGADPAGYVKWTFPAVSEGQTITFSYRVKQDAAAVADNAIGRKHFILWRGSSSCTDLEFSMTHEAGSSRIVPYTDCGAHQFYISLPGGDYDLQYPDFTCKYQGDRSGCAQDIADTWQTYYFEITLGHYSQPDSTFIMWQLTDSGWKRFTETHDYVVYGNVGYNNFMLTTYMTGRTLDTRPAALVQFDDLIMSTAPMDKALLETHP